MNTFPRKNNFDLLRLFAALQVVVFHCIAHLKINDISQSVVNYIANFPGVLMFFAISGFLISSSLDRSKDFKRYAYNRILRIFPALYCCFIITLVLLLAFSVIRFSDIFSLDILKWASAQVTIFQYWTPDILRTWGVGTPNGSLWTIPVEIQFYLFLPCMVFFFKKIPVLIKIFVFSFISIALNFYLSSYHSSAAAPPASIKLIMFSVLPYLYAFLIGSGLFYYWEKIKFLIEGKGLYWFLLFNILVMIAGITPSYWPEGIQLVSNIVLAIMTISLAFTFTSTGKVLNGQDISYGVYIYHMLVINSLVELKLIGKTGYLILAIFITVILATLSWTFVEKKALRYKYKRAV